MHALSAALQEVDWFQVGRLAAAVVPIWLCGAIVGLLIPRPKWMTQGTRFGVLLSEYVPYMRQLMLWLHAGMIVREIWNFRQERSGHGKGVASVQRLMGGGQEQSAAHKEGETDTDDSNWYVTRKDLEFYRDRVEREAEVPGAGTWEVICDKKTSELEYISRRRALPNGTTEYKSTTISYDATAEEFMDFFLNDPLRKEWDGMITHTEVIENGDFAAREQVVRWIRSFPFSFMTDREYVLARRVFRIGDCWYGITKGVDHPDAPASDVIRVDEIHSMWRSRTIPSPRGDGEHACETVLLHCENMKVPEKLARFAVRHGMWGFVKKMGPCTRSFLQKRRKHVDPFETDPMAFGYNATGGPLARANGGGARKAKHTGRRSHRRPRHSCAGYATDSPHKSSSSDLESICEDSELSSPDGLRRVQSSDLFAGGTRSRSARRIGALVALGVAMGLARALSSGAAARLGSHRAGRPRGSEPPLLLCVRPCGVLRSAALFAALVGSTPGGTEDLLLGVAPVCPEPTFDVSLVIPEAAGLPPSSPLPFPSLGARMELPEDGKSEALAGGAVAVCLVDLYCFVVW
eukprot:CAMPEP_0177580536 /NCGR_PEP_ID=MMETSP0419_2-20121207/1614_1 /TAXON_ID=582737 /ORGANISM="Tetraselmis sp., Strain GSL018" /LENGTH=575 /DNA_ID=CAMNT_0019069413 /DNA_START=243 /DNA_END=1968 /DNA_ORIENTATION=+